MRGVVTVVVDERGDGSAVRDLGDPGLLTVAVRDGQDADLSEVVVVPRAAEPDDGRAGVAGELALDVTDTTGGGADDDGVVRAEPELPDDVDRGAARQVEPAGDLPPHVRRLDDDGVTGHDHPGGVRAALGGVAHDLVTDAQVLHAVAACPDDPGHVDALTGWEVDLDVVLQLALAEEAFDVVEAGRDDLDEDLAGSGRGPFL